MAERYKFSNEDTKRIQHLLKQYHTLFPNLKCKGECLEHIVAQAINGKVLGGHNKEADIQVNNIFMQIKSGDINNKRILTISGYRLTRFNQNFKEINRFLHSINTQIITVPTEGGSFCYQVYEIDYRLLKPIEKWTTKGKSFYQTNLHGVTLSISPSMSWQIWWKIPVALLTRL